MGLGKDREKLKKIYSESGQPGRFLETDSTISIILNPGSQGEISHTYYFAESKSANILRYQTACISCYEKDLENILSNEDLGWKKINGNQYVSRFGKKMLLETDPGSNRTSFRIMRTGWTRKSYRLLLGE
jgi:hypothetical protein